MYKSRSTAQYTSPQLEAPYNTEEEQDRLFELYIYLHQRIHSTSRPLKILFHVGPYETLLGWVSILFCCVKVQYRFRICTLFASMTF